jgi:hypothetical protein
MKLDQFVITGKLLEEDETYFYTSDGIFNKHWYRKMGQVVEDGSSKQGA